MWTSRISVAGLMLALASQAWAGSPSPKAAAPSAPAAARNEQAASASALHFIADDSTAALAEAKRRHVPIFVEAWAPW